MIDPMVNFNIAANMIGMVNLFPMHQLSDIIFVSISYQDNNIAEVTKVISYVSEPDAKHHFDLNRERDYLPIKPANNRVTTVGSFVSTYHNRAGQSQKFRCIGKRNYTIS